MIGPNWIKAESRGDLDMYLWPYDGGGYLYEWQDGHGRLYACGRVLSEILDEAHKEALKHWEPRQ